MNFTRKTLEDLGRYYFKNSLSYFPERYIPILLKPDSNVPKHVAYLCPICLQNAIMFIDSPTQSVTSEFTEDHYPPKSIGGKKFVLVCRECNSKAGHDYDFALKDHLTHLSFQKKVPNSSIKSRTIIPNVGKFKGKIALTEKGELQLNMKNNERDEVPPLDNWIEYSKTGKDWEIQIEYRTPHDEKVEKALIHAAYLTCFEYFGYEYIFSEGGQLMRDVMNNPQSYPANALDLNLDSEYMLQNVPLGLGFISYPQDLQSMMVNLKLTLDDTGYTTIKTVLIPNPTSTGIEELRTVGDRLVKYTGDISMLPLNNFLKMEVLPPYRTMWETLLRDYGDDNRNAQ
ncbi:MAG: hypothetical protein JWQ09_5083 [Segetibacter sp.]|nr:hypothetical protein [Segetibacter sp.]